MSGPTLSDVSEDYATCWDYIEDMEAPYRGYFQKTRKSYRLNKDAVEKLTNYVNDYVIVAVFSDTCSDSRRAIPVLALLEMDLGIEVRALGGMKKPPIGSDGLWEIPPSPQEVDTFGITSSPTIIVFKKTGEEIGRIKTMPRMTKTVEQEIVKIIEDSL
ncbi:MAG: thioredoxin family protein [Candidatus Thorarchaeota archaeon]